MAKEEIPRISDIIKTLTAFQEAEGDLPVAVSEGHEYWGNVYRFADEYAIEVQDNAQPNGPKKEGMKCLVFKASIA